MVIYLDMLIVGKTREKTITLWDKLILLLQCLGFAINEKKSVTTPVQEIEFLVMIVNSKEIAISFPKKKLQSINQMCRDMYQSQQL